MNNAPASFVVLVGPTGAGKTELSLVLAAAFNGEIVNCDSIQVYRGLEIGAAKLPQEARGGIPHHLLDVISIEDELTAGTYSRLAREAIGEIQRRGGLAIVVGGTGFYLRALLAGLSPAPVRDAALRGRLEELARRRPGALHRFLRAHDREAAERIHPNDRQKLIRAVEMICLSCEPASVIQKRRREAFEGIRTLKIGLDPERSQLYERLNERCAWMFRNGLLVETQKLLDSGSGARSKALQSLGYKQAVRVLAGELSVEAAILECQARTRQYAKRQMTWFRREPDVVWLAGFGHEAEVKKEAIELTRKFLGEGNEKDAS